jgi:ABC-type antimicrobial peptide transport system permease subunit
MTLISEPNSPEATLLGPVLKRVVQTIDRDMPVFDARSMKDLYIDRAQKTPKLITDTVAWLGAVGLMLAVVGLYGLLAHSVGRRTREIGIRMALGADRQKVVTMVIGQGAKMGIAGLGVGLVIGSVAYKAISSSIFFNFGHLGMLPFAAVSLLLFVTMMVASYVPAKRASHIDPMRALRDE